MSTVCTDCSGGCKNICGDQCSTSCTNDCYNMCLGCTGGCDGTCWAGCSNSCYTTCQGNCYGGCKGQCRTTCTGECKGFCATICQTFCETEQTFAENAIGKGTFSWTEDVSSGKTIQITATEWNTLKSYIKAATQYCGGISPTVEDVDSGDFITEEQYNSLADGLNIPHVVADVTIISADVINKLRDTYNDRLILENLPEGGGEGQCCQKGQTCMATGQYLSHQGTPSQNCGNQIETKPGS